MADRSPQEPRTVEEVLRARIKEVRERRVPKWSRQKLADEMSVLGFEMSQSTVAAIEGQGRGSEKPRAVKPSELLALALVLDVAPINLLLPLDNAEPVQLSPGSDDESPVIVAAGDVRQWLRGEGPGRGSNPVPVGDLDAYQRESPEGQWLNERRFPGGQTPLAVRAWLIDEVQPFYDRLAQASRAVAEASQALREADSEPSRERAGGALSSAEAELSEADAARAKLDSGVAHIDEAVSRIREGWPADVAEKRAREFATEIRKSSQEG